MNDEWPDIENDNTFDWSLSLKEIEKKYGGIAGVPEEPKDKTMIINITKKKTKGQPKNTSYPTIASINKLAKKKKNHAADVSLSVNTNTKRVYDEEHQLYLSYQTQEQFELSKKHGWIIAKLLTEPQTNFHEPEIWQVRMFKNNEWVTEKRIYYSPKDKSDFDLLDVPGLRKNAILI